MCIPLPLRYFLVAAFALTILAIMYQLIHSEIYAKDLSRVDVLDNLSDWMLVDPSPEYSDFASHISHGKLHHTLPATRIDCKDRSFPSSDLASVTYYGSNRTLGATLWLNPKSEKLGMVNMTSAITNRNFSDGFYRIDAVKNWNKSLDDSAIDLIAYLHRILTKFTLVADELMYIDGNNTARKLTITYDDGTRPTGNGCTDCKEATEILLKKQGVLYIFSIFEYNKKLHENPDFRKSTNVIINSIKFNDTIPASNIKSKNWTIYENEAHRVRTQYPSNWTKLEGSDLTKPRYAFANPKSYISDNRTLIVAFQNKSKDTKANFEILIDQTPQIIRSIANSYLKRLNASYSGLQNYTLLTPISSTDSGRKNYTLAYEYSDNGTLVKVNETGNILGDDKVYATRYIAEPKEFDTSIPFVHKMISYLYQNFSGPQYWNQDFHNLNISMKVPHNWEIQQIKPELSRPPFGYGNYSNYIKNGIQLWIPNQTSIYPLYKEYRMDIAYDSLYSLQRNKTEAVGVGAFTYALVLRHDWLYPYWNETLEELAPDGGSIPRDINPNYMDSPKEGSNFVPLKLDLTKLNLPDQFYVTFSAKNAFLKNGLLCTLTDRTPFVSIPPPVYTLKLTDTFVKGLRPGEETDIQVRLYSNTSLPFQVSFYPKEQKDVAGFTFKPQRTFGISKGLVTSDLHIKVLPNAERGLYGIPVVANITLTPILGIANPDFSTPAKLKKTADLVVEILPPKDSLQQMSEAGAALGNAMNGFLGIVISVLGIGGSIIALLFRR